jgi:hypothetical protein
MVSFDDSDILRNKIVTPAWYRVLIMRVGTKPAKGDNPETTTIWPLDGKIIKNMDNGSEDFAGVPTPAGWNFNDNPKAKGFIIGFLEALGVDVKSGARYDLVAAEGKEIGVYISNDTYEGRVVNRINHQYKKVA